MSVLRVAAMTAAAVVVAGCGATPADESIVVDVVSVAQALDLAQSQGHDWEVSVLEDGTITAGEYEDAYDRYMECLSGRGYVPGIPKYLDPINGVQWRSLMPYEGTEDPDELHEIAIETDQVCGVPLQLVEVPYVNNTPHRMESRLLARFKECLDVHDIVYAGDEVNYNEFTADLSDEEFASGQHFGCLQESMRDVHPDAMGGGVAR